MSNISKATSRIVVVGVGALGSHLAPLLRNTDCSVSLIDFDRIESKNLSAQMHAKSNVGRNKAESMKQLLLFLFGTKIDAVPHKLTADNTQQLLGHADLVVDCLDNAEARMLVQTFVRSKSIPCVHGGLAVDGQYGRVCWDEDFVIDAENVKGQPTCEGGQHLPFIAAVSGYLALSVQQWAATDGAKRLNFEIAPGGVKRF